MCVYLRTFNALGEITLDGGKNIFYYQSIYPRSGLNMRARHQRRQSDLPSDSSVLGDLKGF